MWFRDVTHPKAIQDTCSVSTLWEVGWMLNTSWDPLPPPATVHQKCQKCAIHIVLMRKQETKVGERHSHGLFKSFQWMDFSKADGGVFPHHCFWRRGSVQQYSQGCQTCIWSECIKVEHNLKTFGPVHTRRGSCLLCEHSNYQQHVP